MTYFNYRNMNKDLFLRNYNLDNEPKQFMINQMSLLLMYIFGPCLSNYNINIVYLLLQSIALN